MPDTTNGTEIAKRNPQEAFRGEVVRFAHSLLANIVGEDRVREAAGRVELAFRQAAIACPDLYSATPLSIANAVALSAVTGLMPGGAAPLCWLIPRKEHGRQAIQWMASFRGLIVLCQRAGARLHIDPVFSDEGLVILGGTHRSIGYTPKLDAGSKRSGGRLNDLVGVYVAALEHGRVVDDAILPLSDIIKRRASSAAWSYWDKKGRNGEAPIWEKWPIEMSMKTAVRWAVARGMVVADDALSQALRAERDDDVIDVEAEPVAAAAPAPTPPPAASALDDLEETYAPDPSSPDGMSDAEKAAIEREEAAKAAPPAGPEALHPTGKVRK